MSGSGASHESVDWDFFVSYTAADRAWAEWISWQLEDAGYRVLVQAWDFVAGSNWQIRMQQGVEHARRTVAVLSTAYLTSVYGKTEWQAAQAADPDGFARKLLPVRVENCPRPGLLGAIVSIDLFDHDPDQAILHLLNHVRHALTGRAKPTVPPGFPVTRPNPPATEPDFPGEPTEHDGTPTGRTERQALEDTLTRDRRVLGEDRPDTLADSLVYSLTWLGEHRAARELAEDTLARQRSELGDDHPDTLGVANNLVVALNGLGEHRAARELAEDTLTRDRRVLGEDHPDTLGLANSLVVALTWLGEHRAARELAEDTLTRDRRVFGEDHPDTLRLANNLVYALNELGEHRAARKVRRR